MGCASSAPCSRQPTVAASSSPISVSGVSKVLCIFDFDDTLVPWYKMKRDSNPQGPELFREWLEHSQTLQQTQLEGNEAGWNGATCFADLPPALQSRVRAVYSKPRETLVPGGDTLPLLEARLEAKYGEWISHAHDVLEEMETKGSINVLLTAAPLCAAYAKSILFGFARHFEVGDVYSAAAEDCGKTETMRMAIKACAPQGTFTLSCGDGKHEKQAAQELEIPHVHVAGCKCLRGVLSHAPGSRSL